MNSLFFEPFVLVGFLFLRGFFFEPSFFLNPLFGEGFDEKILFSIFYNQ
ncbi:hypothetical protein HPHPP2B_1010 [Helicobacter pylori Hp P-2b]|uniref:Uncharacterized protein n=1 Tax=Helicobacter pylori Hp P-2 TaxID=992073 RepID=J0PNV2_HELPX|nr:hypothetical protein HPHPP2_1007 [Helicobacter pylori Hp P-2]EJC58223.1 hypothetical protein HPHPP2B_1010 [Helicobacter pylori Hp P-2b]